MFLPHDQQHHESCPRAEPMDDVRLNMDCPRHDYCPAHGDSIEGARLDSAIVRVRFQYPGEGRMGIKLSDFP